MLTLSTYTYPVAQAAETRQALLALTHAHSTSIVYGPVPHYALADTPEGGWRLTRAVGTGRWASDTAAEAVATPLPGGRLRVQYRVPWVRFANSLLPVAVFGAFVGWQQYNGTLHEIDHGLWAVYGILGAAYYARIVYITRRRLKQLRADVERNLLAVIRSQ